MFLGRAALLCAVLMGLPYVAGSEPAQNSDADARAKRVIDCLLPPVLVQGESRECKTLAARMGELQIPGVSIAVIHDGRILWAEGFGVNGPDGKRVNVTTLFQAGSISKPVAAMGALHLVQQGKLSLDTDIDQALTSWHLPASSFKPVNGVTLRELLTHTGGIGVHGFPGYAAGAEIPSLVQVLDGAKPANTGAIRIEQAPGAEWNYSGGGFTVMQQAMIDVAHKPFPGLMSTTVLGPIGMKHSTYDQPLPEHFRSNAAVPYAQGGKPVQGGAHTYPEMAAAGLWTTPSDLARYILEVQNSLVGKANHVLSTTMTREMLTPGKSHWGLGVETGGSKTAPYFTHGGVNEGFQSFFVGYESAGGYGVVVMTNAEGGMEVANDVVRSVAVEYGWPDFKPGIHTIAKVDRDTLQRYVGTYMATPTFGVTYTLEGDQLFCQASGQEKYPIFPEGPSKFFMKVVDAEIEFHQKDDGQVDYLVLHQDGQDYKEMKK